MEKIERARKFYRLLKAEVLKLNKEGASLRLQPSLSENGNMKIHLEGAFTVDTLIEVPRNPDAPLVVVKETKRYFYFDDNLVDAILSAAGAPNAKEYLPNLNPAVIPT